MRRMAVLAVMLSLAACGPWAAAQSEPVDPVLEELLQAAEAGNPELREARELSAAAAARPAAAGALPDPSLSVAYTNDGWSPSLGGRDMTTLQLMASQALPGPGKRVLRSARASAEARLAETRVDALQRALRASVKRAYAALRLARLTLELLREQAELLRQVEGVARARYAVGQGGQQDLLRAQVELTRVEPALATGEALAGERLLELNRLVGRPLDAPIETSAEWRLAPLVEPEDEWRRRLADGSAELRGLETQVEAGRLDLELARREFRPDWAVSAGYMNRGGLEPMWQAGVSFTLPIRRARLHAGLAEAEARASAARTRQAAWLADLELGLRLSLSQLRATERNLEIYERGLLPQGRLSVEAAVASYQAGKLPFVSVLEALSSLYADRVARLGLLATHASLRAGLEEAQLGSSRVPSASAEARPGPASAAAQPPMSMAR